MMPVPVRYDGIDVYYTHFDSICNVYDLLDSDRYIIGNISSYEFKLNPQLQRLGNAHGRHRKPGSTLHIYPIRQSSGYSLVGAGISPSSILANPFLTVTIEPIESITIEDAGIRAGEVTASRCWWVSDDYRLNSVYMTRCEWLPGQPMQGDVSAGVGVHAFKEHMDLLCYATAVSEQSMCSNIVCGTVAMWGEIVEHERGWRAEYAKITSLITKDEALLKRYNVPQGRLNL